MPSTKILLIDEGTQEQIELLLRRSPEFDYRLEVGTFPQIWPRLVQGGIDVVLLDGWHAQEALLRQLNAQFPQVPVIVLGDEAEAIAALQLGVQEYLAPSQLDSQTLVRAIRYSIERQRRTPQPPLEAQQKSEDPFRTIIDRNADGMLIINEHGVIELVNPSAQALFGRQCSELIGTEFGFPLVKESIEIDIVGRTGEITAEMRLVEVTWHGKLAYLASLRDITWRKQAEAELKQLNEELELRICEATAALERTNQQLLNEIAERRRSEELLRTVVAGAPVVLWSLSPTGQFTFSEGKGLKALGLEPETIVGRSVFDFSCFYPDFVDNHRRVLEGAERHWQVHINNRVYECRVTPLWDHQHQVAGAIGVATDISDRVRAEAQRTKLLERERVAREEAEKANRLKDEFLAILSHELRTPLNPILGWTSMLRAGTLDTSQTERALETIERNAQLQNQLIQDLLDVSRILQGKLTLKSYVFKLEPIVKAAIETVQLAAHAKSIEIVTEYKLDGGSVLGDPDRLQQIVWNLLSNAVKFTLSGGRIDVRLRQAGTYVQLQVQDTGKGIDPAFLPYLFDKFRQENSSTTRAFGGLGLGLAIVRHLVELHGGTVSAHSPGKDQGATFTVELPLVEQTPSEPPQALVETPSLEGVQLLIIDDDADSLEMTSFWLKQHGAQVTALDRPQKALNYLANEVPDIMISDIGMPEMDGCELMRQIRAKLGHQRALPAIALTAYASETDRQTILAAGFNCHLTKPIEPFQLIAHVAKMLKESRQ